MKHLHVRYGHTSLHRSSHTNQICLEAAQRTLKANLANLEHNSMVSLLSQVNNLSSGTAGGCHSTIQVKLQFQAFRYTEEGQMLRFLFQHIVEDQL